MGEGVSKMTHPLFANAMKVFQVWDRKAAPPTSHFNLSKK